jgi:hypothetical protein
MSLIDVVPLRRGGGGYQQSGTNYGANPERDQMQAPAPGGYQRGGPPGYRGRPGTVNYNSGTSAPSTDPDQDAYAYFKAELHKYGLDNLADWAITYLVQHGDDPDGFMLALSETKEFKVRFWAIDERAAAGLPPISVEDVLTYEAQWNSMANKYGLPPSMQGRDFAQKLMVANVSPAEAEERITQGYVQMHNATPEVKQAFNTYFGVQGDAALAAFFIDPELAVPDLEKMVDVAKIGGTAQQHGWNLSQGTATQLAGMGLSEQGAQQGFAHLDTERHLFTPTLDEDQSINQDVGIAAEFGMDGVSQERLRQIAARRKALYSGSNTAVEDRTGIIGLGQARSV